MSDDHSNLDKNSSKFQKKRGGGTGGGGGPPNDYKQQKRNHNKDYQVMYESKGYEKPPRDQLGPNKGNYSPAYDDYGSKPPRNDNYQPYKSKPHNTRQRQPNVWRKKTNKISRENILETFSRVEGHRDVDKWLKDYKELFVKERQPPVNDEVFQLDPNEGLMAKASRAPPTGSTTQKESDSNTTANTSASGISGTTSNKVLEMFDFAQERFDPIQALRDKLKGNDRGEGRDTRGQHDELLESEEALQALDKKYLQNLEGDLGEREDEELERGNKDLDYDDDEEKYSDIDNMFEKKLKNNEYNEVEDDAFEELIDKDDKKVQLAQMENDERPVWEDLDTNKVIEDIKKEDFLASLPQDKGAIFGKEYNETQILNARKQGLGGFGGPGGFGDSDKGGFSSNFEIDFSQVAFDMDLKSSNDDFLLKSEDLFNSFTQGGNNPQRPLSYPLQEGNNPNFLNQMGYGNPMLGQQGNMQRIPPQNQTLVNNMPSVYPYQQMGQMPPQVLQMQRNQHMQQQMGQMPPMDVLGKMPQKYHQQGNQPYMGKQPNPLNREPGRDMGGRGGGGAGFPPRQQINPTYPSFLFKYFSQNYDEKIWYYIDLQKRVQGPFAGKTMDEWYINGHLPLNLHVTYGNNPSYKTLKELADIIVNKSLGIDDNMYQQPPENIQQQQMEPQQGFSGISELLKNRPDLAQFGANAQAPTVGKAKVLDEVEKSGGGYPQQMHQRDQGNQNYQKSGANGSRNGDLSTEDEGYQNAKQGQKKGKYNKGRNDMLGDIETSSDKAKKSANFNNSPGGSNQDDSLSQGPGDAQAKPQDQNAKDAKGDASNQTADDMTNQLKNMLGLGGGLGGLGGLLGFGNPAANPEPKETTTASSQETTPKQQTLVPGPEKMNPMAYMQPMYGGMMNAYPPTQLNYPPKQYPGYYGAADKQQQQQQQERPEKQEKQQQQQQQQSQTQRKGSKAPKIDTNDFPSLTETYK